MSLDFLKRLAGMTRETKLGLVVACSFLSLLGVVLFLKMNEKEEAAPVAEAREGNVWGAIWESATKTEPAKPVSPPATIPPVPVASNDGNKTPGDDATGGKGLPDLPGTKQPKPLPGEIERVGLVKKSEDPLSIPNLPSPPTPSVWAQVWNGTAIKDGSLVSEPAATVPGLPPALPSTPEPKQPNVWGTVWAGTEKKASSPSLDLPPVTGKVSTPPPIPGLPPVKTAASEEKPAPRPIGEDTESTAGSGLPGLPPIDGPSKPKPPPIDIAETKPTIGETSTSLPKVGEKSPPGLPPVVGTKEETKPPPSLPEIGASSGTTTKPPPLDFGFPPTVTGEKTPKDTLPKLGSLPPPPSGTDREGSSTPRVGISLDAPSSTGTPVSIGTAPGRTVPSIGVTPEPQRTPRGPQPQVIEYLESMRTVQAQDTFEKISLEKYGSADYAAALRLYNRGHPIVGENFASENTPLTPGQRIFLPENPKLLESRYPAAIKSVETHTQSNAPPAEPVQPKKYTVAAGGESFARIASKLLANVDRWPEIRNLNRELDPEKPIPAGTILKVPGDARTP
jgi:hypothetical protein